MGRGHRGTRPAIAFGAEYFYCSNPLRRRIVLTPLLIADVVVIIPLNGELLEIGMVF